MNKKWLKKILKREYNMYIKCVKIGKHTYFVLWDRRRKQPKQPVTYQLFRNADEIIDFLEADNEPDNVVVSEDVAEAEIRESKDESINKAELIEPITPSENK